MLVNWINTIVSEKSVADKLFSWTKVSNLDPNVVFTSTDSVFLLGIMIQFLADTYDIVIHSDRSFYMICYGKQQHNEQHILKSVLKGKTLYIESWFATTEEEVTTIQTNYIKAIDRLLQALTEPF